MLDNNPFSGALAPFRDASRAVFNFVFDRLSDLSNFVGVTDAPPTEVLQPDFDLPFEGGQCVGDPYSIIIGATFRSGSTTRIYYFTRGNTTGYPDLATARAVAANRPPFVGAIPTPSFSVSGATGTASFGSVGVIQYAVNIFEFPVGFTLESGTETVVEVINRANPSDPCGNLPNPNPPFDPSANPFGSGNLDNGTSGTVIYSGLPVLTAAGILAALRAIADAISAISDILSGVQKIGDALKKIADLLKELLDGKKEDDKEKPKNRKYSVGSWYNMSSIDGLIETKPIQLEGKEAIPYQMQVVIDRFPSTASRVLGVNSPSITIDSLPLFYLLLQEDCQGITAVKEVRTLNSCTSIPPFHKGIFWNFRLNPQLRGKYRLFYQTEPIEEEIEPT